MDKENANVVVRKNMTSSAGRTPPRMRCVNIKPTLRPNPNVISKHSQRNDGGEENFSFQNLRGAAKSFEQKQQQHFSKNARPLSVLKNRFAEENMQPTGTSTCSSATKNKNEIKKTYRNKTTPQKSRPTSMPRTPPPSSKQPATSKNEDFSFQALKQRALQMEGNRASASKSDNDQQDFSFQTLKQKAVHIEQHGAGTPLRSKSRIKPRPSAPNTPLRTPAKRSVPMTPQTAGRSKSRCRDSAQIRRKDQKGGSPSYR